MTKSRIKIKLIAVMFLITRIITFFIPETSFFGAKRVLYRMCGVKIGKNTRICSSALIVPFGKVTIGYNVWIGPEVRIYCNEDSIVEIQNNVGIGPRAILQLGFHEFNPTGNRIIANEGTSSTIVLEDGSSIGAMAIILPGKRICKMAFVGAGSLVSKDIPAYSIAVGNPCKPIKKWNSETQKFDNIL